jgi:hypothetical protein
MSNVYSFLFIKLNRGWFTRGIIVRFLIAINIIYKGIHLSV